MSQQSDPDRLLISGHSCSKPTIIYGIFDPNTATVAHEEQYRVTCELGYILEGSDTLYCNAGALSTAPACTGRI